MPRYATTDVHGCLRTFRHVVETKLQLPPSDELYLLGDYVNKGPDSRGVLEYIMQLQAAGFQVYCLRGNHDQALLDAAQGRPPATSTTDLEMTLDSFDVAEATQIPEAYLRWLDALPYQLDIAGFTLVHAGFDFHLPPSQMRRDWNTMLTTKQFTFDASRLQGRRLLHGHVPTPTTDVQRQVAARQGAIGLDTGCVYRHNPELAHLAVLDLDSFQLTLQPNLEEPYPIARR